MGPCLLLVCFFTCDLSFSRHLDLITQHAAPCGLSSGSGGDACAATTACATEAANAVWSTNDKHPSASSKHAAPGSRIWRSASLSFLATEHSAPQQGAQRAAAWLLPYLWIVESKPQPIRSATILQVGPWSKALVKQMTMLKCVLFLELD